jgi:hypothetical protein
MISFAIEYYSASRVENLTGLPSRHSAETADGQGFRPACLSHWLIRLWGMISPWMTMRASPLAASSNDPGLTQTVASEPRPPALPVRSKLSLFGLMAKIMNISVKAGIEIVPIGGWLTPASPAYT